MLRPEQTRFIGLENYLRALTDMGVGGSLMGSLGYFLLTVPAQLLAALGLAALLSSERIFGKALIRPLFFMPSIIPAGPSCSSGLGSWMSAPAGSTAW